METGIEVDDSDLHEDIISQFPFLNGYTHVSFGFRIAPDTSREAIVVALRAGVEELTKKIPWLGGQVICVVKPGQPDHTGVFKAASWPLGSPVNDIVRVNHCEEAIPSMAQLVRTGAPISVLDPSILTPWPCLPQPHGITGPIPVLAVQANFIHGGVILTMTSHHNIMDGTGISQCTRLLATVMNGGEISPDDLEQANRDRSRVVPLIPHGEPVKNFSYLRRPADFKPPAPVSSAKWCYFRMPVSGLPRLRKLASSSSSTMLSDNDILCAFCWKRISAVRLARGSAGVTADTLTKFNRAIDGRAAVGVPPSYMGHVVCHAATYLPFQQVANGPLSTVAAALRRDLNSANSAWAVRSYATFLAREPDRSKLMYGGPFNPGTDLGNSSSITGLNGWREEANAAYPYEPFGPLIGRPCFLRRPYPPPVPGVVYFHPVENGTIPILLCLPEADLEGLKRDAEWRQYIRHIG